MVPETEFSEASLPLQSGHLEDEKRAREGTHDCREDETAGSRSGDPSLRSDAIGPRFVEQDHRYR